MFVFVLIASAAVCANLCGEPYFTIAGGFAEQDWRKQVSTAPLGMVPESPADRTPSPVRRTIKPRWGAAVGWRPSSSLAFEVSTDFGGQVDRIVTSRYFNVVPVPPVPNPPNQSTVVVDKTVETRKSSAITFGPVFSIPLGRQFSMRSRQHVARFTDVYRASTQRYDGFARDLPNLPLVGIRHEAEEFVTWHWQPSLGLIWTPRRFPRCEFGFEAHQSSTARVEIRTIIIRGGLRF